MEMSKRLRAHKNTVRKLVSHAAPISSTPSLAKPVFHQSMSTSPPLRDAIDEASLVGLPDEGPRKTYVDRGVRFAYYSSILWRKDCASVISKKFMTDNFVVFWLEYLSHEEYGGRGEMIFLHPGAQFMLLAESFETCEDALKDLELSSRKMIFLPLTSDETPGGPVRLKRDKGGSHRSLLVWVKREDAFYHYDSSPEHTNQEVAEQAARQLWAVILKGAYRDKGTPFPGLISPAFPRQTFPQDSGCIMLTLLNLICMTGNIVDMEPLLTPLTIFRYREYMTVVVKTKVEEYLQLKGSTSCGKLPSGATIVTGAAKMARGPLAEDLESVVGALEDLDSEEEREEREWAQLMGERTRGPEAEFTAT